ncbi:hypothetical protein GN244_ATG09596 [Phytophthora infestans]|uniref:Uncharacterized protein n=1 Tax=Phytophthora infestans TaxID=4787 RepID=A0A833WDK0_PHYIN|nr:hypothetical protein GN244_ATG09596 [Phytophthora infestans]
MTTAASSGPRSLPKIYSRLKTLTQLTNTSVRGLHTGNFVARSELRWKSFDGQDSPNSARNRAMATVTESAELFMEKTCSSDKTRETKSRDLATTARHRGKDHSTFSQFGTCPVRD